MCFIVAWLCAWHSHPLHVARMLCRLAPIAHPSLFCLHPGRAMWRAGRGRPRPARCSSSSGRRLSSGGRPRRGGEPAQRWRWTSSGRAGGGAARRMGEAMLSAMQQKQLIHQNSSRRRGACVALGRACCCCIALSGSSGLLAPLLFPYHIPTCNRVHANAQHHRDGQV